VSGKLDQQCIQHPALQGNVGLNPDSPLGRHTGEGRYPVD